MEDAWLGKATERIFLPMIRMLFPEIVDMNLPIEGAFHNLVLVSIKKQYPFHAARVAHGLWGAGQMMFSKVIVVFDDDVDVQDAAVAVWRGEPPKKVLTSLFMALRWATALDFVGK